MQDYRLRVYVCLAVLLLCREVRGRRWGMRGHDQSLGLLHDKRCFQLEAIRLWMGSLKSYLLRLLTGCRLLLSVAVGRWGSWTIVVKEGRGGRVGIPSNGSRGN